MAGVIPLGDNVLVELNIYAKTPGGIMLPQGAEQCQSGFIVAIGQGVPEEFVHVNNGEKSGRNSRGIKIGDKVFLPKGDRIGDKFQDGTKILLNTKYAYISAIVDNEVTPVVEENKS